MLVVVKHGPDWTGGNAGISEACMVTPQEIARGPEREGVQGATVFMPLKEVIQSLSPEQRGRWERLWMVSDRQDGPVHPLIYPHPNTGTIF